MLFEITGKNENGDVVFKGTASRIEASYLMDVGVNYLLAKGVAPVLTGKEEKIVLSPTTDTAQ